MTPLWPTNDTRRQPWQTFAPPLHIWPPLLSQTTLVKQDDQGSENQDLCPRKRGAFSFITQTFAAESWHSLISHGFSQLWSGEGTGECQRFSTFGLIFICHISSLCELGRKEKSIFLTYSEVAAPALGYCLCQCTFQFRLWTYNLSVWVILHKYDPRSYCYLHIPTFLCYSNFQFVIFKYFKLNLIIGDFWENLTLDFLPFTFEQIFPEKTFWIDSLINFLTKEIFRISKYFPALFEKNVSKCVFLKNGQTYKCSVNTVNRSQYLSPRKRM